MKTLRFLLILVAVLIVILGVNATVKSEIDNLGIILTAACFFLVPYFVGTLFEEFWVFPFGLYLKYLLFWLAVMIVAVPVGVGLGSF